MSRKNAAYPGGIPGGREPGNPGGIPGGSPGMPGGNPGGGRAYAIGRAAIAGAPVRVSSTCPRDFKKRFSGTYAGVVDLHHDDYRHDSQRASAYHASSQDLPAPSGIPLPAGTPFPGPAVNPLLSSPATGGGPSTVTLTIDSPLRMTRPRVRFC